MFGPLPSLPQAVTALADTSGLRLVSPAGMMTCHQADKIMNVRQEQLRAAKRRQRLREKRSGQALYQIKLPVAFCERLKFGMRRPDFVVRLCAFLEHEIIPIDAYPNLAALCWNRDTEFLTREEAFKLYERNWRLVDSANMGETEAALVHALAEEFGQGLINA